VRSAVEAGSQELSPAVGLVSRANDKRRPVEELLAEELRHLDPDEVYAETVQMLAKISEKEKV